MFGSGQAQAPPRGGRTARSERPGRPLSKPDLKIFGKLGFLPNIRKNRTASFTRLLQNRPNYV